MAFENESLLRGAQQRIKALAKTVPPATGPIWLDRKKTFEELKPNRVFNRAKQFLTDTVETEEKKFTYNHAGKQIKFKTHTVAWVISGTLKTLDAANFAMTPSQISSLNDYANGSN